MYEETYADKDDYVLVDLVELPSRQGACQFECCFQGLTDAAAVVGRYLGGEVRQPSAEPRPDIPTPSGIVSGQTILFRDLESGQRKARTVVSGRRADRSKDEISAESPIGRALLGREIGDVVSIDLPRGAMRVEVREVRT